MSLKLASIKDTIKVILRIDSALVLTKDTKDYELYLKTLDENLLKFKEGEEPTRIVMRKVLPLSLAAKVQDMQMSFNGKKTEMKSSFTMLDVRFSIVGVEEPASVPPESRINFELAKDGGAPEEFVAQLAAAGVIMDLWTAKTASNEGSVAADPKK